MDSAEAIEFEKENPDLVLLRSYEQDPFGIIIEIFYNPGDKIFYSKGFYGAGKGDLKTYVKMPEDSNKRKIFIENIGVDGITETVHNDNFQL